MPSKCLALAKSQCLAHVDVDSIFVNLSFIFIIIIIIITPRGTWGLCRAGMVMTISQLGTRSRQEQGEYSPRVTPGL